MIEAILYMLASLAAAGTAQAADIASHLHQGGAIGQGVDAIRQLLLWFDLFESGELNHWINVVLGIVETLAGAVLITMGLRQLDFTATTDGEELHRIARRTTGEAVKTALGHFLRLVGILRVCAGFILVVANLL